MDITEDYMGKYEELSVLQENPKILLLRNLEDGAICVKKVMALEQKPIYDYLKSHKSAFIPQIYESYEELGQLHVIEEYIEGKTLSDCLKEEMFSVAKVEQIMKEVCLALQLLHHARPMIVCRDLKAENIMMTKNGTIKLFDFDVSRIYQPGQEKDTVYMGTEGYAAPEQFGILQTDHRSDIYALGVLLNVLLTGELPVKKMAEGKLGNIVKKCTALNPNDRYQSVNEVIKAIEKRSLSRYQSWFLPGFRSGQIWKMIIACIGYYFILDISYNAKIEHMGVPITGILLIVEQTVFFLAVFLGIMIMFNYRNIRQMIPFPRRKEKIVQIITGLFYCGVLVVIAGFICALMDAFVFGT